MARATSLFQFEVMRLRLSTFSTPGESIHSRIEKDHPADFNRHSLSGEAFTTFCILVQ